MKKHFDPESSREGLREKLIGLGEHSIRKSYYPELQKQLQNLKERVDLAELVAEIGQGLTEEQSLRSSLQRCTDTLEQRTDAAFVRIWTLDHTGKTLQLQASSGLHTHIDGAHSRISLEDSPYTIGIIARQKKPFLTNHVLDNPQFHNQEWVKNQGIVSFAGYPLVLQNRLVGFIALFAQKPLNETVLKTLATIANQVAVGIEHLQLLDAYKKALTNARENHEKVNGILRSVADALLVIDDDQHILHMNQAAESLLGFSLAKAFRKKFALTIKEPALLEYLAGLERHAHAGDEVDLEMTDMSRNEHRTIQARAAKLKGAKSRGGVVISLRDVTQDREVARLKSEFITTAAHELRTPLTTIKGFAELLKNEAFDRRAQSEYLGYILDNTDQLEEIICDLLDLSRIESGRGLSLNYSHWDIEHTLKQLLASYRSEHRNYRFKTIYSDNLGMIDADQSKILQVLDNLLSNAMKFSPVDSEILLQAQTSNDTLTITVTDQGIGMTEEQAANSFERFYRADTSDTAVGGLGIGLSIVRHVVEAHGGEVKIKSRPHRGTEVTFTLPIRCHTNLCKIGVVS